MIRQTYTVKVYRERRGSDATTLSILMDLLRVSGSPVAGISSGRDYAYKARVSSGRSNRFLRLSDDCGRRVQSSGASIQVHRSREPATIRLPSKKVILAAEVNWLPHHWLGRHNRNGGKLRMMQDVGSHITLSKCIAFAPIARLTRTWLRLRSYRYNGLRGDATDGDISHCAEFGSDTPDYIVTWNYICKCGTNVQYHPCHRRSRQLTMPADFCHHLAVRDRWQLIPRPSGRF